MLVRPILGQARPALLLLALSLSGSIAGCKKDDAEPGSALAEYGDSMRKIRLRGTPLVLQIPKTWKVTEVDKPPLPKKPDAADAGTPTITLTGRRLFEARARVGAAGAQWAVPRLEIFHDPWLPVGTSAKDYLDAQRKENERAVNQGGTGPARIRHVEAERSRRQGRPSYHVRDEFTYKLGNQRRVVSQESLLLVDQQGMDLHGYTLVLTMTDEDLQTLARLRRAMIESVRFAKP